MSLVLLGVFVAAMLASLPLAFALGTASLAAILSSGLPLVLVPQRLILGADSLPLMAVPFFILVGHLMNRAGMTRKLIDFANALVGRLTGGLALTNVLTSMLFAGVSGSAVADTSGLGSILIPAMKKEGYGGAFSAAITAASSVVGPIIPPSIPMVLFGITAGVSIGALFLAGAIPGIILGVCYMIYTYVISRRRGYPQYSAVGLREIWRRFRTAIWALLMPVIILGGIFGGIFTVTESAAIAVLYALFVGFVVYRKLSWRTLRDALIQTALDSAVLMLLIGAAQLFGWMLAISGLPRDVGVFIGQLSSNPWVILLIINVFLLMLGTFMETTSAMLIMIPILLPIVQSLGIDAVHFGVIMVFNLLIGLMTPPVGICLYLATGIAKVPVAKVVREIMPFLAVAIAVLALITFVPDLVLFLPGLLTG